MAEITPTRVRTPHDGSAFTCWQWGPFSHGDTFVPVLVAPYSDKSIKFSKDGGFGGGVGVEGSMIPDAADGWHILLDSQHLAISNITAPGVTAVRTIMAHVYQLRPTTTPGLTGVTAYLTLASGGR